jgi:hypothetical protein
MVGAWLQMLHKLMGDDSIKKHSHKKLSPLLPSAAVLENTIQTLVSCKMMFILSGESTNQNFKKKVALNTYILPITDP